jgi:hypothetical protein
MEWSESKCYYSFMFDKREVIALILWWAEGTKSRRDIRWKNAVSYPIEVTNTNPAIIKIFLDYVREDLKVSEDKIRLQIQLHEGDDKHEIEDYWSDLTQIPKARFNKTIIRPVGKKSGKSKGTCKVRFADKTTYKVLEAKLKTALKDVYEKEDDILRVYEPGNTELNLLR